MYYVYILRSLSDTRQSYVGYTSDLKARLYVHNRGESSHTSRYRPWKLVFYCAFSKERKAKDFELYLKSHSGKAFTAKRLV